MTKTYRIGQIVPSSEHHHGDGVPAMLLAHQIPRPEDRFTFHSSRMRMKHVVKEELAAMDAESDRCAPGAVRRPRRRPGLRLPGRHHGHGPRLPPRLPEAPDRAHRQQRRHRPVITSAGALIEALKVMKAGKKIALVAPYMKPLTELVMNYIAAEGFEIVDHRALEIPDNPGRGPPRPAKLPGIVAGMDYHRRRRDRAVGLRADASLPAVAQVEAQTGKPVLTAAIATTYAIPPGSSRPDRARRGALLSGAYR